MIATAVLCSLAPTRRAPRRAPRRAALLGAATTLALPRANFAADDFAQKAAAALLASKGDAASDEPALKQAPPTCARSRVSRAEARVDGGGGEGVGEGDPSSARRPPATRLGGTRVITLEQGAGTPSLGIFKLAKVEGGGGDGEPAFFSLPAMVGGDTSITVDFRPKGGAKDVTGAWDGDGIQFPGVKWKKIQ